MQIEHPDPICIATSGFPLLSAPLSTLWLTFCVSLTRGLGGGWGTSPLLGAPHCSQQQAGGVPQRCPAEHRHARPPARTSLANLDQTHPSKANPCLPSHPHPLIQGWARGSSGVWRTRRQHPRSGGRRQTWGA